MKKKLLMILAIFSMVLSFWGCEKNSSAFSKQEETFDKNASYALGFNVGLGLKDSMAIDGIFPNMSEFMKGIKDGIEGKSTRLDDATARAIITEAINKLNEKKYAVNLADGNAFLAENSKKPGVIITPSGLQYEVITEGSGSRPSSSDIVKVHYEGRFIDGYIFDNSYEQQTPVEFPLGRIIPGWSEGLQLMSVGSKYKFYIPYELGYGPEGFRDYYGNEVIPPYSPLVFTVELFDFWENQDNDFFNMFD